jgi:DNA polymerase-1
MFGWTVHVTGISRPTTLRNYMMQASGSEMLRAACCLATERGILLCAPVHDALLVEGPAGEIKDVVAATRAAMGEASVLDGKRGQVMWDRVMDLL